MKFEKALDILWLASFIEAKTFGNKDILATGINEIHKVEEGDITFVDNEKYYQKALDSAATIIIIDKEVEVPHGKVLLQVDEPFEAYNKIVKRFRTFEPASGMIAEDLEVGEGTIIQPGVFIGNHCVIGKNCIIHANVSIYDHTIIGDNVIIHSGAVIGSEAFYYKGKNGRDIKYEKMESCGRVIIHHDVEIGAGTTIDKGVSGDTIIGAGTKMDNHVHIGHGVVVGRNCLFAAQVGIGGKAIIEDNVTLWGQVGVSKDLTVGNGAVVNAQSGIPSSIEGNQAYFGSPATVAKEAIKTMVWTKRVPELWKKLEELEKKFIEAEK